MANCFINKLRGMVNNSNLPKYNSVDLMVKAGKDYQLVIYKVIGRSFSMKRISGDGYINESGTTEGDFYAGVHLYGGEEDTVFRLYDKYNLTWIAVSTPQASWNLNFGGFNIEEFEYCTNLTKFLIEGFSPNATGDIAKLKNSPLTDFDIKYDGLTVELSDLATMTTIETLGLDGNSVSGTLSQISSLINLTSLSINGLANVSGDVEVLLDAMKNVRLNGDTFTIFGNGVVKYDNAVIANNSRKVFTFDGNGGYTVS